MPLTSLAVLGVTILLSSFISGTFGMAGGMVLLGVLLIYFPVSAGTFPTDSGLFVGLLVGVIVIVGGLTYFPAVALGPLAEQFAMQAGTLF